MKVSVVFFVRLSKNPAGWKQVKLPVFENNYAGGGPLLLFRFNFDVTNAYKIEIIIYNIATLFRTEQCVNLEIGIFESTFQAHLRSRQASSAMDSNRLA